MQLHIKRGNLESETKYGWEGDLTILMEREKKELVEEKNTLDACESYILCVRNTYISGVKFLEFSTDERLNVLNSVRIMNLC